MWWWCIRKSENLGSVPVTGEEFEEAVPQAVVLADEEANGPADVLVPASHGGPERDGRPHLPRRHLPHYELRRLLAPRHWKIWLRSRSTINDCIVFRDLARGRRVRSLPEPAG